VAAKNSAPRPASMPRPRGPHQLLRGSLTRPPRPLASSAKRCDQARPTVGEGLARGRPVRNVGADDLELANNPTQGRQVGLLCRPCGRVPVAEGHHLAVALMDFLLQPRQLTCRGVLKEADALELASEGPALRCVRFTLKEPLAPETKKGPHGRS
jgi:hypothetical protein